MPKYLWAEGVRHIVWLMNRTGTKAVDGKTPFEVIYGKKPDLHQLHEWGEDCWVHQLHVDKLSDRAKKAKWLGYDPESNGMRVWFPDTGAVKVERNVRFGKANLEGEDQPGVEILQEDLLTQPDTKTPTIPTNPLPDVTNDAPEFNSDAEDLNQGRSR